ncbi:MAG: hypothetical protein HZA35_01120 [Parcubacteria group bacterium]|nr:hypothetical protein [Parcubacteria group bacterium]
MKAYVPQHIRTQDTRRKRLRFSFFLILGMFLLSGVIYGVFFNPKLLVANITISGFDQSLATQFQDAMRTKKILKGFVPSNNLLFIDKGDFISVGDQYPEIKNVVMQKDYRNARLDFSVTTRKPEGLWCGEREGCYVFDTDGVIYIKQEMNVASSSFSLVIEDSNRFPTLLSPVQNENISTKKIRDGIITPELISVFKGLLNIFKENGVSIKTIIRRTEADNIVLLETNDEHIFLIDGGRSAEDSMRDFLLAKNKIDFQKITYVDLRIPGRVYYK